MYAEQLKDDPDIELIHFSRDQDDEKTLAWANEHKVQFPVVKPKGGGWHASRRRTPGKHLHRGKTQGIKEIILNRSLTQPAAAPSKVPQRLPLKCTSNPIPAAPSPISTFDPALVISHPSSLKGTGRSGRVNESLFHKRK